MPTKWEAQIARESRQYAEIIRKSIEGKKDTDTIRLPRGDSKFEPVSALRKRMEENLALAAEMEAKPDPAPIKLI